MNTSEINPFPKLLETAKNLQVVEVRQKVIADVMEALTGASLMENLDFEEAVNFLTCCDVLPSSQPAHFDQPCRGDRRPRPEMLRFAFYL